MRADGQAGDHPDDDALAEYSAGLLAPDEAAAVEEHVAGCADCSALLGAAEGVPGLLQRLPDEPMPADLAARLERSVRAAVAGGASSTEPAAATGPAATEQPATGPTRVLRPMATATGARTGGARKQQRSEERTEERTFRWLAYGRIAAVVLGVLVLGTGAVAGVRAITGGGTGAESATSAGDSGAGSGTPLVTVVLATGTDYTSTGVKKQVEALVAQSRSQTAYSAQSLAGGASDSAAGGATRSQESAPASGQESPKAAASGGGLRDTATLKSCLSEIGRADEQPVAVDLATYESREAAAIVLQEPDGTYEVWFVSRNCGSGSAETFGVETIQP